MTPRATVRLQLTREFDFDGARDCIDYYAALGISHYYLSPVFRARSGSSHGYDCVDFATISDERGGAHGFAQLAAALRASGMGILLDIVPNHMGVAGNDNAWWNDVLSRGRHSDYAGYFDIDWEVDAEDLKGKVLLPYLDRPFDEALANGLIRVECEPPAQTPYAIHYDSRWPLSPASRAEFKSGELDASSEAGRLRLRNLLERQHFRLADWHDAAERINWRRFFDISELAALRTETEPVFEDVHKAVFSLFEAGLIDGVRVDHVDGLAYPLEYCRKLCDRLQALSHLRPVEAGGGGYIVVEKIFAAHEPLRDWGVAGTTGYEFMDQVSALLHNPSGQAVLDLLWRDVSSRPWEFRAAVTEARRLVLAEYFGADLRRVARAFFALTAAKPDAATFEYPALSRALTELVVAFPVYRTYGMPGSLPPEDAAILAAALERANRELKPEDYPALDFLAACLRDSQGAETESAQREAAVRFQQLTAPIAAKAIEDTVFYREARLLSRNDVGSDPNVFTVSLEEFHAACDQRARRFPHGLLATATHDHKRGEDVRARLAVLSDVAERWSEAASRWHALNAPARAGYDDDSAPDAVDEQILYQTLAGAWPLEPMNDKARENFHQRLAQWWRKALREAKRHSNWITPNTRYEEGCLSFLAAILSLAEFREQLTAFVDSIAAAGALNSLTQTFLRLTTPGVPDLYQGCEFWDFSLADPDNRRTVDYTARREALQSAHGVHAVFSAWRDGRVKQQLIAQLLRHRAEMPAVYATADYRPLAVRGEHSARVIAFERRCENQRLVCIASRWPLSLAVELKQPRLDPLLWQDAAIELSDSGSFEDVLREHAADEFTQAIPVAHALRDFPVALYFSGNRA